MASDAEFNMESINERVNLTSELSNEKQDEQMKKVIKFVGILMHMERTMNENRDEIIRLNYNENENVLVNSNNPKIVQSSLDSYAGIAETYDKNIIKIMPILYLIVMGLTNTLKKTLHHERVIALYELVCMEFQAIFGIIDAVLFFSLTVCGKTKNKSTFKKWFHLSKRYFIIVKIVNRVSAVISDEFKTLFHDDMTQLDEILQENNEMIDIYKEAYRAYNNSYRQRFNINQSQSNQPNHNGGRTYKRGKRMTKQRKRHGRTHKKRA